MFAQHQFTGFSHVLMMIFLKNSKSSKLLICLNKQFSFQMPIVTKYKDIGKEELLSPVRFQLDRLSVERQGFWNTGVAGGRNIIQKYLDTNTAFSFQEKTVQEPDELDI